MEKYTFKSVEHFNKIVSKHYPYSEKIKQNSDIKEDRRYIFLISEDDRLYSITGKVINMHVTMQSLMNLSSYIVIQKNKNTVTVKFTHIIDGYLLKENISSNLNNIIKEEDNDFFPEEYEDDDKIAHYHH